jgi:mRNA-degrading endonuclease RelE of RelBE toxin-antitoxin system
MCAQAAATQFAQMRARAQASPDSAHAAVWKGMRRILDTALTEPTIAFAPNNAARQGHHDFGGIFRLKVGRSRIFYVGSKAAQRVTVLFVGFRKDGDANDAYAELSRRVKSGEF